jgi:hypothetical protein
MTETNERLNHNWYRNERRQNTRYEIHGDAWFQWQTEEGRLREGSGSTRNMGRVGTFIETASIPPIASQVNVVVTFAINPNQSLRVRLCGTGDVRRVRRSRLDGDGFGAWVLFHTETAVNEELERTGGEV